MEPIPTPTQCQKGLIDMAMKYKIWVTVEEIDENMNHYQDVAGPYSIGPEHDTRTEALEYIEQNTEVNGPVDL